MAEALGLDPATVEHITDLRPIAVRRKRRASAAEPLGSPRTTSAAHLRNTGEETQSAFPATPARQKRVRFSFPPDASTGLTQHVARTHLVEDTNAPEAPNARLLAQRPRRPRRAVSDGPRELTVLTSNNVEVQFKPIRQILSERTKRRLSRNHMSEAMNEIEAQHKSHNALSRELLLVRHELQELTAGSVPAMQGTARIRGLEAEVDSLKRQLRERPSLPSEDLETREGSSPIDIDAVDAEIVDMIKINDNHSSDEDTGCSSPIHEDSFTRPATPTTPVSVLDDRSASESASPLLSKGAQTDLTEITFGQIQEHLQTQAEQLKQARLDLERLLPGETSLPLASPTKRLHGVPRSPLSELSSSEPSDGPLPLVDAQPLLAALFQHLHKMSERAARTAQALAAAEDQKANLKGNFRAALRQLDETRAAYARLIAESQRRTPATPASSPAPSETGSSSSDGSEEHERHFGEARKRIDKLEADAAAYDRDRAALISALDKYRTEVKQLETLVTKLESTHTGAMQTLKAEHSSALSNLMGEHAEAIEDLEAQLDAESRDRQEAESEIDAIMGRWGAQREQGDRDMGRLNVQIANLTEQLKDREKTIVDLHSDLHNMRQRVELFFPSVAGQVSWADMEAGCVDPSQPELPRPSAPQRAHTVPPSTKSLGLLTPSVEGGRFRDAMETPASPDLSSDVLDAGASIPGKVELGRGKRRSRRIHETSSIGIVVEEAEEQ